MFYCSFDKAKLFNATKILNHTTNEVATELFSANIYWCRVVLDGSWGSTPHKHSFFELHLPVEGGCEYQLNEKLIPVEKGQLLLVAPGVKHSVFKAEGFYEFVLGFEITQQSSEDAVCFPEEFFLGKATDYLFFAVDHMLKNAVEEKLGSKEAIKHQLAVLLIELFQQLNGFKGKNEGDITNDMRIKAALEYIENNLARPMTVADVASYVHLSKRHLNRITEKALSMSVSQLIASRRIRAAKKLLTDPSKSIGQIAEETGFPTQQQFSKVFRRAEGITPTAYRKDIGK